MFLKRLLDRAQGIRVHPTACVDDRRKIGRGTKVWHFSHIMPGADIGSDCVIGQNCYLGSKARVGNNVKLQNNVSVYDHVRLEDGVFVGPSAVFTNDINPRALFPKNGNLKPTVVKKGASIGANATIVCGVTIGRYAFVGAGALVNKDVQEHAIVAGVPARVIGWMCVCGQKIGLNGRVRKCSCGRSYRTDGKGAHFLDWAV